MKSAGRPTVSSIHRSAVMDAFYMSIDPGRREALQRAEVARWLARLAQGAGERPATLRARLPPAEDLVNLFEFEEVAKLTLDRVHRIPVVAGSDGTDPSTG